MTENDPNFEERLSAAASECQRLIDTFLKQLKLQHRLKQLKAFRINILRRRKYWNLRHRLK